MLTAKAVASMLGISTRAVYEIPAERLPRFLLGSKGGAVRYDPADVEAYRRSLERPAFPLITPRVARELLRLRRHAIAAGAEPTPLPPEVERLAETPNRNMRMPPWASGKAIRAIYAEAKRLTAATGVQHQVDHIVPLRGANVSGLHVENNLQILPAGANLLKRNRFEP